MTATAIAAEVVIGGDDVYEELLPVGWELQALAVEAGFAARLRLGTAGVGSAPLTVLATASGEFTPTDQAGLAAGVAAGRGLLAVHASALIPGGLAGDRSEAYRVIGTRYRSHGPLPHASRFTVRIDPDHPATAGIPHFEVDHEHYEVDVLPVTSGQRVLAWREAPDGERPILVAHEHGAGRVCYLQLGHDARVFAEPSVRRLVRGAMAWCTRLDEAASGPSERLSA